MSAVLRKGGSPRVLRRLIILGVLLFLGYHLTSQYGGMPDFDPQQFAWADAARTALHLKQSRQWHRVAKVTTITDESVAKSNMVRRALKTHETQNSLYSYDHIIDEQFKTVHQGSGMSPTKAQATILLRLLNKELEKPEHERLQWIFWFEPNTIILNPHVPLEIFLPPTPGSTSYDEAFSTIHLLLTTNWDDLNTAIFPLHVHPWCVKLFENLLITLSSEPDTTLLSLLQKEMELRANVTVVPPHWFSSMPVKMIWTEVEKDPTGKNKEKGKYRSGKGSAIMPVDMPEAAKYNPNDEGLDPQPWKIRKGDMALSFPGPATDTSKDPWLDAWLSIPENPADEHYIHFSNSAYIERLEREVGAFWEEEVPRIRQLWKDIEEHNKHDQEEEEKKSKLEKGQEGYAKYQDEKKVKEEAKKKWEAEQKKVQAELDRLMAEEHSGMKGS